MNVSHRITIVNVFVNTLEVISYLVLLLQASMRTQMMMQVKAMDTPTTIPVIDL